MDCSGGRKMNIWEEGFLATNNTKCLPWELSTCKTLWALWCSVSKYKAYSNSREKNSLSLSLFSFCFSIVCQKRKGFIYILFFCIEFSFFSIVVTRRQRWNSSFLILSRSIELDKDWEGVEVEHGKSLCCSCN